VTRRCGPFTHWGVLGKIDLGSIVLQAGVVNGWNGFDRSQDSVSGIGSITYRSEDEKFKLSALACDVIFRF